MSTPQDPTGAAPKVLGGRYEIHRRLARGGMAEVYLSRDRSLDRPVAVKMLFPEFATDANFVERFRREAQAAANLTHPNIVGVYDWGAEDGTYFIVMEFVDGQSLAEVNRSAGPLHPRRAAEIAYEVAGALGFAHSRGVVHRDVKPGNILISRSGQSKVADFGIARALSSPGEDLTQAGSVMGTATYFSPEQAQGFAVDARSDLYSLGVVLYETVCGRPPFTGETPVAIAYKHVQEAPPRPSSVVAGIPEGLEAIIGKMLAKNPDARYLSADDLRADLRRFLDGETPAALVESRMPVAGMAAAGVAGAMAGAALSDPGATSVLPPVDGAAPDEWDEGDDDQEEEGRSRTGWFLVALVVLVAAIAGLVFWILTSLGDDAAEELDVGDYIGLPRDEAVRRVTEDGFNPVVEEVPDDEVPAGQVADQDPDPGEQLAEGDDLILEVSTGPAPIELGNFAGLTVEQARALLESVGLRVEVVEQESSDVAAGTVIGTEPPAGTEVEVGDTVRLIVSSGTGSVGIPDVSGATQEGARSSLEGAGFRVGGVIEQPSADVPQGRVIGTRPSGSAAPGTTIDLVVSSGPQQVSVPSVIGQSESSATSTIQDRGLDVNVTFSELTSGDPSIGRVIDQDPAGRTMVDPGSTVTITVGSAPAAPGDSPP